MTLRRLSRIATPTLLLSLLAGAPAGAAPDGVDRCRIAKLAAIASATSAGLRCYTRAIRRGQGAPDLECILPPDGKLERAFARAERFGSCSPTALEAGLAILAYVTAQGSRVLPGPPATPTPEPTATPTPSPSASPTPEPPPGCGNGTVEAGESCDGGAYCDPSCRFLFPDLCCDFGPACVAIPDIPGADQCFLVGGTPRIGASCVASDPGCEDGQVCVGSCTPTVFPATLFCCDGGGGCTESTLSDTESLASLLLQCGPGAVVEGACVAGSCVPGG